MPLASASCALLSQLRGLCAQFSAAEYQQPIDLLSGASLGKHLRHIVEFYDCLLIGLKRTEVCYDDRVRDVRLENDPSFMALRLKALSDELCGLGPENLSVLLRSELGAEGVATLTVPSTLERELLYVYEHTIHHMAILKIGVLAQFPTVHLAQGFGVADSTLRHERRHVHG